MWAKEYLSNLPFVIIYPIPFLSEIPHTIYEKKYPNIHTEASQDSASSKLNTLDLSNGCNFIKGQDPGPWLP